MPAQQILVLQSSEADLTGVDRNVRSAQPVLLSALVLIAFSFAFAHPALFIHRGLHRFSEDVFYIRSMFRFYLVLTGSFAITWLLQPAINPVLERWSLRLQPEARRNVALGAVTLVCVSFAAFLIVFGRWQFGGFDHNILVETGWRQMLGQRPYVDFPTTSPPLFNAGLKLAFHLFGVSWDAMLLLTALFTAGTLVWLYLLFRRAGMSVSAALGTASTIELVTMLRCCFWWYNNTTLVLAAIFFVATVLLARRSADRFGQISFVVSFAGLALAKANMASVTITCCVALLLVVSRQRGRVLTLTAAGAALTLLIFPVAHISLPAMVHAYRGAATERGVFSSFGYQQFSKGEKGLIKVWYAALCLPLISCARPVWVDLRNRYYRRAAFWLLFPLSACIAIYGLRGNGETPDAETSLLLCGLALLAFSLKVESLQSRRYTVALLCAIAASNCYFGAERNRVFTIGSHLFFEWKDRDHLLTSGPLKNMRVSETFFEMNQEIGQAIQRYPGPYFFGPRVDYGYMAFGLRSPEHFPAWWHPGTSFAREDMGKIVAGWEQDRFATLIYLKGEGHQEPYPDSKDLYAAGPIGEQSTDYTYYPARLLNDLHTLYVRDDRYPRITVYHRLPGL